MFWGIKVNVNWKKRYNKELMQLFGDLEILPFFRISRPNLIAHTNRMESKRKVTKYSKVILREVN
jgi:hypothetical protein